MNIFQYKLPLLTAGNDKKRKSFLKPAAAFLIATLFTVSGCGLWYIPGETGDGPVVNNNTPEAVPVEMALQEMINFLTVSAIMNNWRSIGVMCAGDNLAAEVFNGVAPILQWHHTVSATARLESTMEGNVWHMMLLQHGALLWEHRIILQQGDCNQ